MGVIFKESHSSQTGGGNVTKLGQGLDSWVDDARTGKTGVGRVLSEGQSRPHAFGVVPDHLGPD